MRGGARSIVHGDGTSLWTITHADDFAVAFTGLLGNPAAIGEAFTITGTHAPTWNQIYGWLADAAGVPTPRLRARRLRRRSPRSPPTSARALLGDKAHSMLFDNAEGHAAGARVPRTTITFDEGARRILAPLRRALGGAADRRGPRRAVRSHRGPRPLGGLTARPPVSA